MSFSTIIGGIFLIIIAFVIYRSFKVNLQNNKLNQKRNQRIQPIIQKLESSEEISNQELDTYASNLATRMDLFQILRAFEKEDLFPKQYLSFEKSGESILGNWLEFPTELGKIPSEVIFQKKVDLKDLFYTIYKFKGIEDKWTIGVVGPYDKDSHPYDEAPATFSRFTTMEETSPEEEAKWVNENIAGN